MLKAHWLLPEGCVVWRCQDFLFFEEISLAKRCVSSSKNSGCCRLLAIIKNKSRRQIRFVFHSHFESPRFKWKMYSGQCLIRDWNQGFFLSSGFKYCLKRWAPCVSCLCVAKQKSKVKQRKAERAKQKEKGTQMQKEKQKHKQKETQKEKQKQREK